MVVIHEICRSGRRFSCSMKLEQQWPNTTKSLLFLKSEVKNQIINDNTTILKCTLQLKHGIIKDYVKEINGGRKKWL